jgi:acyl carrier protein
MSNDETVFCQLQEILSRVLSVPVSRITTSSSMDNLAEWDSLRFLMVITEVEKFFFVRASGAELKSLRSVKSLMQFIAGGESQ